MQKSKHLRPRLSAVYKTARSYVDQKLSVLPIHADGSKSPAIDKWKPFQNRRATEDELREWFQRPDPHGIGILTGKISGDLIVLDFDDLVCYREWKKLVRNTRPKLWAKLVRIATPSGGRHVYFRAESGEELREYPHLLAARRRPRDGTAGEETRLTKCELKREGRYLVAPGSPAACHLNKLEYRVLAGNLLDLPRLSTKAIAFLIKSAQQFDERPPKISTPHPSANHLRQLAGKLAAGGRPGDEYEAQVPWDEVLEPHGWRFHEQHDETEYWCRPGKRAAVSATVNHGGCGLLYVFSSSAAPLEDGRAYSKFAAYATLNHDGDFSAAASALRREGYGSDAFEASAIPSRWAHLSGLLRSPSESPPEASAVR